MKKLFSIFFAILLLCMSIIPSYAASYTISVKAPSTAAVGETITVSVNLTANSGLGGLDFTVKFNTSEFQLVSGSVSAGSLLMADTNVGSGSIRYAGVSADTVKSTGTLMTFKLKVLKTGGKITLSVADAINGDDTDITSSFSTNGATVKCSHADLKWTVTKKATCTEKGEKKGTCTCGYTTTEAIAKTEHTYGNFTVTKEPTCTEKGEKTATCSVCKEKITESISAKGHTYGKWTVEKEATETEKGLKWAKCTVCSDKNEQAIPVITTTTTETATEKEETTESTTTEEAINPTVDIVEKSSTPKTVAITVLAVLGIEALIGLIIFLIIKNKKKKEQS